MQDVLKARREDYFSKIADQQTKLHQLDMAENALKRRKEQMNLRRLLNDQVAYMRKTMQNEAN